MFCENFLDQEKLKKFTSQHEDEFEISIETIINALESQVSVIDDRYGKSCTNSSEGTTKLIDATPVSTHPSKVITCIVPVPDDKFSDEDLLVGYEKNCHFFNLFTADKNSSIWIDLSQVSSGDSDNDKNIDNMVGQGLFREIAKYPVLCNNKVEAMPSLFVHG